MPFSLANLAASAQSVFAARETHTAQENLALITAAAQKMAEGIQSYNGGMLAAIPLANNNSALVKAIEDTIKDAKAADAPPETEAEAEANAILDYIRKVLRPRMQANIKAVKDKKDLFAASNLVGVMLGKMKVLRELTGQLGEALLEKAPKQTKDESPLLLKEIDGDFEEMMRFMKQ